MVNIILSRASLLLLVLPAALAASCVSQCEQTDPVVSFCEGDETGSALADCTCQSYNAGPNLIACVKGCPSDEVGAFVAALPQECRNSLFPGVSVGSTTTSSTGAGATPAPTSTAADNTQSTSSAPSTSASTGAAAGMNSEWRSAAAILAGVFGSMII